MNKLVTISLLLALAVGFEEAAQAQFSVTTFAQASADASTNGYVKYDGTVASQSITQAAGATITESNVANTPQLTQATGQIVATDPSVAGTASAFATANLGAGTLGVLANGSPTGATVSSAGAMATMSDLLTFHVPGANASTITNIGISFQLNGTFALLGDSQAYNGLTTYMSFGNGIIWWHYFTQDSPPAQVVQNGGWNSFDISSQTGSSFVFNGVLSLAGANPTANLVAQLALQCQSANCDYSHTGAVTLTLPPGVTFTSASGTFLSQTEVTCTNTLSAGGQAFAGTGGSANVGVIAAAGCAWSVSGAPSWITFPGSIGGTGSGPVLYQVQANGGADRSATFTVAGVPFTVEQQGAAIAGMNFIGSMPHIAAEENWTTAFTLVNQSAAPLVARLSLFGDPSGALTLPLAFPQQAAGSGPLLAASLDRSINANASLIIDTAGPQTPPVQVGSAQLAATGAVDGFAIFHLIPSAQEAVVPMETRNASSYLLAFDNTGGVVLGVAVENVSALAAVIPVVIRDDTGVVISAAGTTIALAGNGHTSFVVSTLYPATANLRGTVEFDTPPGGQIAVLGIRTTPLGSSNTLTTIPALANVGLTGGSIAHLTTGNGWQTTFVLVNTGTGAATAHLKFFADTGSPLSLPLAFPQVDGGSTSAAATVDQLLAAGATLIVQSTAPASDPAPTIGSAQLTTDGNIGGFVIFRYNPNGQEAVVPLESRTAGAYVIAFDNTSNTATGIAINSVSTQAVNIPVVVRDDTGAQIATDTISLAANGHLSFTLATDKYPSTGNIRGTIEFDTPAGTQMGALGIRIPVAHTFTTLPALAR
jgi:hypothetical protein